MINSETKLVCLLGSPVSHSKSPNMHNAALKELEKNAVYLSFDIEKENLGKTIEGLKSIGIIGVNVTIPYKEEVIKYVDGLTEEARNIGAVNTLYFENRKLIGDNTDGQGFILSLMKDGGFDPQNKNVVVLGAGGASRAICVKLIDEDVKTLYISDIDERKVKALKGNLDKLNKRTDVKIVSTELVSDYIKDSELIINCTPVGMKETDPELFDFKLLNDNHFVYDVIYNPLETKLLKGAKSAGANVLNGKGMLVYQGALAFERWFKSKPNTQLMFEKL